jgi:hypothetical protein
MELNLWRAFTELGMNANFYEALSRKYQNERLQLNALIANLENDASTHIIDLDAALNVVDQIGDRFPLCTPEQQRAILLQMVERVIIDRTGRIKTIEWTPPFCYLMPIVESADGNLHSEEKSTRTW